MKCSLTTFSSEVVGCELGFAQCGLLNVRPPKTFPILLKQVGFTPGNGVWPTSKTFLPYWQKIDSEWSSRGILIEATDQWAALSHVLRLVALTLADVTPPMPLEMCIGLLTSQSHLSKHSCKCFFINLFKLIGSVSYAVQAPANGRVVPLFVQWALRQK